MGGPLSWLVLLGCYKIEYLDLSQSMAPMAAPEEVWHHRAINGMWEIEGPVELQEICPDGFSRLETEVSLPNSLATLGVDIVAGALTVGAAIPFQIYSPSTVRVECTYDR